MKKDKDISAIKSGMSRDLSYEFLEKSLYTTAVNINTENTQGRGAIVKSEPSNILANKFKDGFRVVGKKRDQVTNRTYFFITNPTTRVSEIGYINNISEIIEEEPKLDPITNKITLPIELEKKEQVEHQTYTTILEDSCNLCLNFDITKPIKKILIKNEVSGIKIFFTDNFNELRYLDLNKIEDYKIVGNPICQDPIQTTCLDCDKLKVFPDYNKPNLEVEEVTLGGRLLLGEYSFYLAYCDEVGNEKTEYTSETLPTSIFDRNNRVLTPEEELNPTNLAIKLKVSNLTDNFSHFKIATSYRSIVDRSVRYFEVGVFDINTKSIIFSSTQQLNEISINKIAQRNLDIETVNLIDTSDNFLLIAGIKSKREINLQPIVNLLGGFLRWQTHISYESLYERGESKSKYLSYPRDEVIALSISFTDKNGYSTALFPFVGRPPTEDDLTIVNNTETQSVNLSTPSCTESERNKKWQYYNTAKKLGTCSTEGIAKNTIIVKEQQICKLPKVVTQPQGSIIIEDPETFNGLEFFLNKELKEEICSGLPFCSILDPSIYPDCTPDIENCTNLTLVDEFLQVNNIQGQGELGKELVINNYISFPEEYSNIILEDICYPHRIGDKGEVVRDGEFENLWIESTISDWQRVFEVKDSMFNTLPTFAEPLRRLSKTERKLSTVFFHSYFGFPGDITEGQFNNFNASCTEVGTFNNSGTFNFQFTNKIHKNALWFSIPKQELNRNAILEITKAGKDEIKKTFSSLMKRVRVSMFTSKTSGNSFYCKIIDIKDNGLKLLLDIDIINNTLKVKESDTDNTFTPISIPTEIFISIDVPLIESRGSEVGYFSSPILGCYGITLRELEVKNIEVFYDSISFDKVQIYSLDCNKEVPVIEECTVAPYEFGEFGYVESLSEYPNNSELYNSSILKIKSDYFSEQEVIEILDKYADGISEDGYFNLKPETDLRCKKIRHFKLPDNRVSPFTSDTEQLGFSKSLIFPLGVTIDENIINKFLDVAVDNNLLTIEERNKIVGYEIFRADLRGNESIVAKGLLYDMYKYKEEDKEILFPNFPYNTLGDNSLILEEDTNIPIRHPFNSIGNYNFTFHSPETEFSTPVLGSELKVEGYLSGESVGVFEQVENHPKYVILGRDAKRLANTLAIAELAAEAVIQSLSAFSNYNHVVGLTNTIFSGAWVATPAIAVALSLGSAIFRFGKLRFEWENTFLNLGSPENFAYFYTSVGKYNSLKTIQEEGNILRGIQKTEVLDSNRFVITNEIGSERLNINNHNREKSIFITTGKDFKLLYPEAVINFDNETSNPNNSSRFTLGQTFLCKKGRSQEFNRRIISPYVSIKNYIPNQYGEISDLRWISTGYKGDLKNPKNTCLPIFGGNTFLTRHTLKRKTPLFLATAMGLANRTPFNYRELSNYGTNPKYYLNYLSPDNLKISRGLPDMDSEFEFDCQSGLSDFYVKPPSKFYLYYYGIPSFLTETKINTNYRTGRAEPRDGFYPLVQDFVDWTQENTVPIKEPNTYFYKKVYSDTPNLAFGKTLNTAFSESSNNKISNQPNLLFYSLRDSSEIEIKEPWLTFKAGDRYTFDKEFGKLVDIKGIEGGAILTRFENQTAIYNPITIQVEGIKPTNEQLSNGGLFSSRKITFGNSEVGYYGSMTNEMVSTEIGHFYVSSKIGAVFNVSGNGIKDISIELGNKKSGLKNWFREQLPFKIKNTKITNYEDIDIDNPMNGVGITMGWDNRFKRVFITKKDFIPIKESLYFNGRFYKKELSSEIINTKSQEGFIFTGVTGNKGNFVKYKTDRDTNIYVFVDAVNITESKILEIHAEIVNWFNNFKTVNIDYLGELYFIPTTSIGWLNQSNSLKDGVLSLSTSTALVNITNLPPHFNSPQWQKPEKAISLHIVRDSVGRYHGVNLSGGFLNQPTPDYVADVNKFILDPIAKFKGVVIPIIDSLTGQASAQVLQAAASIKNKLFSTVDIIKANTPVNIDLLKTENPYIGHPDLGLLGWKGIFNQKTEAINLLGNNIEDVLNLNDTEEQSVELEEIQLTDTKYFKDSSWTIAYDAENNDWISYYDFKPNYYITHENYFQTGINYSSDSKEFGLWSHLLINSSFGVFYGKKYDILIEFPINGVGTTKTIESIQLFTEAIRYNKKFNLNIDDSITFNKMFILNNRESSGVLNLIPQKTLSDFRRYPITKGKEQDILITFLDDRWNINHIYNRVSEDTTYKSVWSWDDNQIKKELNKDLIKFEGKRVLERLRGDFLLATFIYNKDSRYELNLKFALINTEQE